MPNIIKIGGGSTKGQYVWARYECTPPGGIDANTILMLHGETLADSSPTTKTLTNKSAAVDSTTKKFGAGSLSFNGSASIQVSSHADFALTDFTIDFWIYDTSTTAAYRRWISTSDNATILIREKSTSGTAEVYLSGTSITFAHTKNEWVHYAIVRSGSTVTVYKNGVSVATGTYATAFAQVAYDIGGRYSELSETTIGYLDEIRFSKIARWTSAFTPMTSAYGAVGDFSAYVVSDIADKYPDGAEQGGYWYESVATPLDA